MGDDAETFTTGDLVALLADAGEIDAGVEVLEAVRAHDQTSSQRLRLQAKLFVAEDQTPERRREVLLPLRDGRVHVLARQGALLEACVALRLLIREFPDEPMWTAQLSRLEDLLMPLPNLHGDARRADADAFIALGRTHEAWELLQQMIADSPHELDLTRRAAALRSLLFPPTNTRPYCEDVEVAPAEPTAYDLAESDALDEGPPTDEHALPVEEDIVRDPTTRPPPPSDDDSTKHRPAVAAEDGVVEVKRRRIVRLG